MQTIKQIVERAIANVARLGKVEATNSWLGIMAQPDFSARVTQLVDRADYSAEALLNVYLSYDTSSYDAVQWRAAIYQFVLRFAYPDNASVPDYPSIEENALVFLELYRLLCELEKERAENSFVYDYPFRLLSADEIAELEDPTEYHIFMNAFRYEYIYELMKLNREIFPYSSLEHITGVHYLALFIARQVKAAGIPVDLGIVSGAAALHDIGKFGCRPDEGHKVAYYHYYYTEAWCYRKGIRYIRNIAVNHSTWDLELESLSIEALILIYSDFRVKGHNDPNCPYPMKFYDLEESFKVILEKLDNVDAAKEKRYRKVYEKLADFESFLTMQGIATRFADFTGETKQLLNSAFLSGSGILSRYKYLSISSSLALMYELRNEKSLMHFLDDIRNTSDVLKVRYQMSILAQFSKYLTPDQKVIVLDFLYDMLIVNEEDLRRQAAEIMGLIITSFDDPYSKYLPPHVEPGIYKLSKSKVLKDFINRFLQPEEGRSKQKDQWIGSALSILFKIVLEESKIPLHTIDLMLQNLAQLEGAGRIYLLASMLHLPIDHLTEKHIQLFVGELEKVLQSESGEAILYVALCTEHLLETGHDAVVGLAQKIVDQSSCELHLQHLQNALERKIKPLNVVNGRHLLAKLGDDVELRRSLYLNNLKTNTAQIEKALNIELLANYMMDCEDAADRFYFAVHLSNLIKNSEHYDIRLVAGRTLLQLADYLSAEKLNEVVIELIRGLEIENYQFAKNIPPILGRLIVRLPQRERCEVVDDLNKKVKSGSQNLKMVVVETVSHALIASFEVAGLDDFRETMLLILFKALVQYDDIVHSVAFNALTVNVFGNTLLKLEDKVALFQKIAKKLLCIVDSVPENKRLSSIKYAHGYNKLYVFLVEYAHEVGAIEIPHRRKVAYFSGSFDPFSLGQKSVAMAIRDRGFEVYLAIDEFNWQRRTQPSQLRRRLIDLTIADQPDIYTMPQLPVVNLKHKDDYMQLKQLFGNREVYIVSSADRLAEKSRFAKSFNGASEVAHLVINRKNIDQELLAEGQRVLRQFKNVDYITIDDELSAITSQQIRSAVDKRWDISDMVDALAAEQIVKHRMYRNAPVYKTNIDTVSSSTISGDQVDSALIDEVKRALEVDLITYLKRVDCAPKVIVMRDSNSRAVNAVAVYRELTEAEYDAMRDHPEIKTDYVEIYKENTIVIDLLAARQPTPLHNHLLMIHSEVIVDAINRGYDYSVYRLSAAKLSRVVKAGLSLSGYREIDSLAIMLTSIKAPVAIMLDAQSMLKRAYRQDRDIRSVLTNSRMALLKALVERYHDTVILTFDRAMLYDKINDIVLRENAPDRQSAYGPNLCVPYGDIYNRWLLPRAVTKALHTERVYDIGLNFFNVKASPNYPPVEAQVEVIKAFNMPLLLVDDLVDKGLRLQALERHFKAMQVPVAGLVVGIMSGLGKVRAEKKGYRILAGYYLPNMTAWYSESHLYPFIGGDAYYSGDDLASNILPSVNKIMPYMCSRNGATSGKGAIDFSMSCLHQGLSIIEKIEQKYHDAYRRPLTINRLNEVFVTPRVPYYGKKMQINHSSLPSDIIKNDVIRLEQIMTLIER